MRRAEDQRKVRAGGHHERELVGAVIPGTDQLLEHAELGHGVAGRAAAGAGELAEELEFARHDGGRARGADAVEAARGADELGEVGRGHQRP
jgi:hypothetical protein